MTMYEPLFLSWAKHRIRTGYCPIILIVGKQRAGKTCMALKLAYELDHNFNVEEQLFFDVMSFAKAVKKYNRKVLVLDEAGVELDTYRYSDVRQRCFSHIIQSQAYKQNTLFIVLPHGTDLAKCHRKNIDVLMVIPTRGAYFCYKPNIRYWDLNDLDIRTKKMEMCYNVPLPPNHIFMAYKSKFEKQVKIDILDSEINKLEKALSIKPVRSECPSILTRANELPNQTIA